MTVISIILFILLYFVAIFLVSVVGIAVFNFFKSIYHALAERPPK